MSDLQNQVVVHAGLYDQLLNEHAALRAELESSRDTIGSLLDEIGGHERWLTEMVADYRLCADPHRVSQRLAINGLIHDLRACVAELEAERDGLLETLANVNDYMKEALAGKQD